MNCVFPDNTCCSRVQFLLVLKVMFYLTCAKSIAIMIFLGIKVDLLVVKAAETIPLYPGKILTLFLATIGMEICCM